MDVTVVLPVHNEAGHLDAELARIRTSLEASGYSWEIIVVDDASTDGSVDNLVPGNGIRLIRQRVNQGSGGSRRVGTEAARGAVVVWTDADMTYPNDRIAELVGQLEGADQVVGARTTEEGTHKVLRTAAKWLIRRLAQYLASTRIPDLNSGYRAFRRDVAWQYTHLLPKGFSCVTTLTMAFLTNGYTVRYVEIEYRERAGESKFHWYRDTRRSAVQVVRMALSWEPLRLFLPTSLLILLATANKVLTDFGFGAPQLAVSTMLMATFGGLLLAIGFLADLVVRTSKAPSRVLPAYVVEVPEPDAERGGT
ncbi:MAG: glycosyltransferase family 2 protein [Candidatus Microthrix parvicella]